MCESFIKNVYHILKLFLKVIVGIQTGTKKNKFLFKKILLHNIYRYIQLQRSNSNAKKQKISS